MLLKAKSVESICILILCAIISSSLAWDVASPQERNEQCAQIFFQSSFKGQSFILRDDEQVSNLTEIQSYFRKNRRSRRSLEEDEEAEVNEDSPAQLNQTDSDVFSFRVQEGCKLQVSPLAYLKGNVQEFLGDVEEIASDWFVPKSVACECPKLCRCEDIKLRQRECGRAYVKDDCTNCKAAFTTLKTSHIDNSNGIEHAEWTTFPETWSSQVTTVLLREGCNVTMQFSGANPDNPNLSPSVVSTSDQVTKNVMNSGSLTQYICQCSVDSVSSESGSTDDDVGKYPPLVTIPRTKGGINMLLSNRKDLKDHPGLIAALQSLRSRKSSKNAYILLLGMSGSGKSSAVNLLFDHPNITKVGDYISTTKDILQFSIPVPVPQLGMNNTALHVIDTPGIGDTSGIAEDARFLATLDDFLSKNTDLKRSLPNVVLIFSKFSDNRFSGEGSPFVKMLRTIDLFKDQLIDKRSTTVIFVLTHYMSETKETTRDPSKRIAAVRRVIQEYSTLPRPVHIVLAENKPEERHLLNVNGYYRLPNGEFYPKNLFDKMQWNLVNSEDPVGEAVIRTAFSNSDEFEIQGRRYPLLSPTHEMTTKYLGILGAFNKPVAGTEVSVELQQAYSNADPELQARYADELNVLQRQLYARNIWHFDDLPKTSTDIIKLMEEIQINPLTLFLLQNALNLTIPDFPARFVVGYGYSLTKDEILSSQIFKTDGNNVETNDFLYKVPEVFKVTVDHGTDSQFQVFTNKDDLFAARLRSLGLPPNTTDDVVEGNETSPFPGFNLISLDDVTNASTISWNSLAATVDYHAFQISLSSTAKLSEQFVSFVNSLNPLDLGDPDNVKNWQEFFERYGTHVVTNAFGGGTIKIKAAVDNSLNEKITNGEKFSVLSATLANLTEQLANELIGKDGIYSPPEGVTYRFSQKGGSHKNFWANFSDLDEVKNVETWRESLKYEPVVLTNRLQVVPISKIIKSYGEWEGESVEDMIREAAASLLNASLVFIPVERVHHDDNPESRDRTERKESDYQQMQEFSMILRMISETNQGAQAGMLKLMQDSEKRKHDQEQQWQMRLQLSREEQARKDRLLEEESRHDRELQLKREQMEMQRLTQEKFLREQQEESRRQAEMQQWIAMKELQQKNEHGLLNFINAENARRDEIIRNQKGWLHRLGDFVTGGLVSVFSG